MDFELNSTKGHLELIVGPMFSGKTTELMRKVKRFTHAKKKCLVVNYSKDNRYSSGECIINHDKQTLQALKVNKLDEIVNEYQNYDVIAIDEGQFFQDIVEKCDQFANNGKIVLVAALDADFQRKSFGQIAQLLPIAEKIQKLNAVCLLCSNTASFTKRIVDSLEVELIGGDESYIPVCRQCFFKNDLNKQTNNLCSSDRIVQKDIQNQQDLTSQSPSRY